MTFWLVCSSYSLHEWQAVKLTFFAPRVTKDSFSGQLIHQVVTIAVIKECFYSDYYS